MGRNPLQRTAQLLWEEVANLHPRYRLCDWAISCLPHLCFNRTRALLYRLAGFSIGKNVCFMGRVHISGGGKIQARFRLGDDVLMNSPILFDVNAPITIGNSVSIGHDVKFITTSHEVGTPDKRAGATTAAPIIVESGVWIGAGATILAGVTLGHGSIVGAGTVVNASVPPNTLIAPKPNRQIPLPS